VKRGARVSVGINETTTGDVNEPPGKIFSSGDSLVHTLHFEHLAICARVNNTNVARDNYRNKINVV